MFRQYLLQVTNKFYYNLMLKLLRLRWLLTYFILLPCVFTTSKPLSLSEVYFSDTVFIIKYV